LIAQDYYGRICCQNFTAPVQILTDQQGRRVSMGNEMTGPSMPADDRQQRDTPAVAACRCGRAGFSEQRMFAQDMDDC